MNKICNNCQHFHDGRCFYYENDFAVHDDVFDDKMFSFIEFAYPVDDEPCSEWQEKLTPFESQHASGWPIVERLDRNVVCKRGDSYCVGHLYDPKTGSWAWGHYGLTKEDAHELLLELCLEDIKAGR